MHVTEVLEKDGPRSGSPEMRAAIQSEVQDLLKRIRSELPNGANTLIARFDLAIKSNADGKVKYKARYVMGGHSDKLKQFIVHGSQTLQTSSSRLLLVLSSIFQFDVWSTDVKLAYLQSSEPLQ